MIKGSVACKCGGQFSFESVMDQIGCPYCQKTYATKKHGVEVSEEVKEIKAEVVVESKASLEEVACPHCKQMFSVKEVKAEVLPEMETPIKIIEPDPVEVVTK